MNGSPPSTTPEQVTKQLRAYAQLVRQYAGTLDLSSPRVLEQFKYAISKTVVYDPYLPQEIRVLDIGSGVGLPAIPIAIRRPDINLVVCEIRKRRAAFLERAVSTLNLPRVRVYNGDVQQLRYVQFDAVIAQAVGRIGRTYTLCQHLLKPSWIILTIKGATLDREIEELKEIAGALDVEKKPLDDNTTLVAIHGGDS